MNIVVGGTLYKKEIMDLILKNGNEKIKVAIMGDLEAAMALRNGQADYYFGSCQTGAGGALSMAIALNGMDKCLSVAMVGKVLEPEEIAEAIQMGKTAFGFVPEAADKVIPIIMREIVKQKM